MNNFLANARAIFNTAFNRIDTLVTQRFSAWEIIPRALKWIILCFSACVFLLLIAVVIVFGQLISSNTVKLFNFAIQNPQTMWAIFSLLLAVGLLMRQIRLHGIVVTAVAALGLLLLVKYAASLYGTDVPYVDVALQHVIDLPRLIMEDVLPWFKDALSTLPF